MGNSSIRVRATTLVAALTFAGGVAVLTAPAASADEPIPPISCGVVNHETGPLSATVHGLEKPLLPINLGPINLAYFVHDLNCNYVINLEYLLGLQPRPTFP